MHLGHVLSVIAFVVTGLLSIPMAYPAVHRSAEQQPSSSVGKPTDLADQSGSAGAESRHPTALKAPPTT